MMRRIAATLLLVVGMAMPPAVAAAPTQLFLRAVDLGNGTARVTWQDMPSAALTCLYAPRDSFCLVAGTGATITATPGEIVMVTVQSTTILLAVGAAQGGPPPVYLPQILFFTP